MRLDQVREGRIHEVLQTPIGLIGLGHATRLPTAFFGKSGLSRIRHPYLQRAQSRCAKRFATLLDSLLY